jgi:uncharacterized protein (DUF1778 family)
VKKKLARKSYTLQIRIAEDVRDLLTRAADFDALEVSTWVRSIAVRAARERVAIAGPR